MRPRYVALEVPIFRCRAQVRQFIGWFRAQRFGKLSHQE